VGSAVSLLQTEPLFFLSASISTLLFLLSFVLLLLGGHHGQVDGSVGVDIGDGSTWDGSMGDGSVGDGSTWDGSVGDGSAGDGSVGDASADAHHLDSAASFKIFTMQSILAFFMGFGWLGLACRLEWGLGYFLSGSFACLFGASLLLFTAFLMSQVYRLNAVRTRNLYQTLGDGGKVYLTIPEDGKGKVQAVVDGSMKIVDAVSKSGRIEQFKEVEIVGVVDQSTLIVREK
jgi:hypothetical protein